MVGLARSFPLPETGNVPGLRAACHRTGRVVFRQCAHRDRASLCAGSTSHAAPALCLPHFPCFRSPSCFLARPVFRWWCSGDTPDILRCISEVDSKIPCVCRALAALAARCNRSAAFAAYSTRIEYCWPVSGPDMGQAWPAPELRTRGDTGLPLFLGQRVAVILRGGTELGSPVPLLGSSRILRFDVEASELPVATHIPHPVAAAATLDPGVQASSRGRAAWASATPASLGDTLTS